MPDDKVRVGIIGIGVYSMLAHVPGLRGTGKAELAAICRRNAKALADAREALRVEEAYTDWREMLDRSRLDAVIVSTPHNAHAEQTIAAVERGLHVLVEKPMALTSQDAWAMVEAAGQAERVLMVGYNSRYTGCWRAAKRALQDGAIGPVRQVNLAFCFSQRFFWEAENLPAPWQRGLKSAGIPDTVVWGSGFLDAHWRRDPDVMGGGAFADAGSHMADLALWLGGAPPAEVSAFHESAGLPVDCFVNAQARLASGTLISLTSAAGVSGPPEEWRLTIFGDRGMLTADWEGFGPAKEIWLHRGSRRRRLKVDLPDTTPAAAFVSAIAEGGPNLCPGQDGAHAVALTEAAYRSAAEERLVRVDLPEAGRGTVTA